MRDDYKIERGVRGREEEEEGKEEKVKRAGKKH